MASMSTSVQVRFDSGSTNNFIFRHTTHFLNLPIPPMTPFLIRVGIEQWCYTSMQYCVRQSLSIQIHSFPIDLFVAEGSDVVLGVQWLKTLRPILTDCSKLYIDFHYKGQQIHLQAVISSIGLHKLINSKGVASSYMCFTM